MGLFTAILLAIGGACFILLLLQAIIAFRKEPGNIFIFGLSLTVVFLIFTGTSIYSSNAQAFDGHLLTGLKMQSIMTVVVMTAFLGMTHFLLRENKRGIVFSGVALQLLVAMVILVLPEYDLFGANPGLNLLVLSNGERFLMIAPGITLWRLMINLSVFFTLVLSGMLIWRNYHRNGAIGLSLIIAGLIVMMILVVIDQMIDMGSVQSYYLLTYGMAAHYLILVTIPFEELFRESSLRKEMIDRERKWRILIHQANVIVVVLNRMGHVDFANPYFYKLTGFRENEVIGKDWFEFFVPSDQSYDVQSAFIEILEFDFHPHYRNPILTKYHEKRMIDWYNVRLRDSSEQVTGSISFGIDITEETAEMENLRSRLREMEQIVRKMKDEGRI